MQKLNTIIVPIIRQDFIGGMLQSLWKFTPPNFNVIVIDQTNNTNAYEKYKELSHLWIFPYRNLGFAKAMNMGARLSQTEYITFSNDDIEFLDTRWWEGIVDTFLMDQKIIAVNPMSPKEGAWGYGKTVENKDTWQPPKEFVVDPNSFDSVVPKKPDGSGLFIDAAKTKEGYDFLLNNHPRWQKNTTCDAIAMWCTIFKRSGLEEIGLLDEKFYPGGGEDYDMNCRAYSCGYPEPREDCDPTFHRRMVGSTKAWVWHHWGKSKDAISGKDPTNTLFASRERWNANDELWGIKFDVWGHENMPDGTKRPLIRKFPVFVDEL